MKPIVASLLLFAACGFDPPGGAGGDDVQPTTPTVGFASTSSSADEMSTALSIQVTLSMASDAEVAVAYAATGGSATAGADYTVEGGTLTFAPGETQQSIALSIVNDMMEEQEETIELSLSGPTGANLGASSHTITIANDTLPRVQFANASSNVAEGSGSTLELVLDKAAPTDVTVRVRVSGGTAAAGDYTFQNDVVVTFPAGSTSQTVPLETLQDALDEDNETVALQLFEPSPGLLTGVNFVQDVSIVDDDAAPSASFLVATSQFGEQGTYGIIVRLSAPSGRTVSVPFQIVPGAANAATPTTDYVIEASPIVFAPGDTEETIALQAVADTESEPDETVDVELLPATDGTATVGAIGRRTHTINDNDSVSVRFVNATGTADEFDIDFDYSITVALSNAVDRDVTVDLVFDSGMSTASDNDFDMPASVTIPAFNTSRQFTFRVTGDNSREDDETVILRLANPTGGATLGTPSVRSVIIRDND